MTTSENAYTGLEIAIIGMHGIFPGATDTNSFWQNLQSGIESITFISAEEDSKHNNIETRSSYSDHVNAKGGVLSGIEFFDAPFFGYTDPEAQLMDPQIRLFHECSYKALEDAGYMTEKNENSIGLYASASAHFYWEAISKLSGNQNGIDHFTNETLINKDFLSGRIAYKLNLTGPCVNVHSSCSSSLVAVHMACRALLTGECTMALAGGVSIDASPKTGYDYHEGMIFSPDGHCRTFDADSRGTVPGEGVGVIVLKRLKNAISDNDHIHAIIKGSSVNNDGKRKVGFSSPSVEGQAEVIRNAFEIAKVKSETISFIETHGTGTILGDPIEFRALTSAFNSHKKNFCGLASVKTNIGHLDAAAGIAGLIKTILCLKNKQIPPSLHYVKPNPNIDLMSSPFYINNSLKKWENEGKIRRAGVSSFGIGGTNAHVILEEAPEQQITKNELPGYEIILISAHTETALYNTCNNLIDYLKANPATNLSSLAFTLSTGRKSLNYKLSFVCAGVDELIIRLQEAIANKHLSYSQRKPAKIIFMFPGQGAQYINMGISLYQNEKCFSEELDKCFRILGMNVRDYLYPSSISDDYHKALNQTGITQPVLFAFEYSLAKLLISWGIHPDVMIGHSLGEYVAAVVAGSIDLEQALKLIQFRAKLIQGLEKGAMIAVNGDQKEILPLLSHGVSLAAVNSSSNYTFSGRFDAMETFSKRLTDAGISYTSLKTSHAFHSDMLNPVLSNFEQFIKTIEIKKPQIPFYSNVTGKLITDAEVMSPFYWKNQLRATVKFGTGITELLKLKDPVFIEVGPGSTLANFVRTDDRESRSQCISVIKSRHDNTNDHQYLLRRITDIWTTGYSFDWSLFYKEKNKQRISLPTYPFDKHEYRIEEENLAVADQLVEARLAIQKNPNISNWFYVPLWEQSILPEWQPHVKSGARTLAFINRSFHKELLQLWQNGADLKTAFLNDEGEVGFAQPLNSHNPQFSLASFFNHLQEEDWIPDKIIYLCSLDKNGSPSQDPYTHLFLLVNICKAIAKNNPGKVISLNVVANDVFNVYGDEIVHPFKSIITGALKTISLEYTNIRCRLIDIPGTISTWYSYQHSIRNELETTPDDLIITAYRGNMRFQPIYKPVSLQKQNLHPGVIKTGGLILVTGGFGGMSFAIASDLAIEKSARIILIGRSFLPQETEWDLWLKEKKMLRYVKEF